MKTPLLWLSGIRYWKRHPMMLAMSIVGVAIGVAVVVAIDIAKTSASEGFRLSVESVAGKSTHQVVGTGDHLDEEIYRTIRVDLGIRDSAPVIEGFATVPDAGGRTIQIIGVDVLADAPFRAYTEAQESDLDLGAFMGGGLSAIISEQTATVFGLTRGDSLLVDHEGNLSQIVILDFIKEQQDIDRDILDNLFVVDLSTAQQLVGMQGVLSRVDLMLPDSDAGSQTLDAIRSQMPAGVQVVRSDARTESISRLTDAFNSNLTALSLLALIVGMFLIYNTMTFSVVQRRRSFGRLRAIGVTRNEIFRLVLADAVLIGVAGTVLGVGAGIILGQSLLQLVSRSINDLYYVLRVTNQDIAAISIAKGLVLGVFATIIAAIQPAREATGGAAAGVLQRSQEESVLHSSRRRFAIMAIVLAVSSVLLLAFTGQSIALSYAGLLCLILSCSIAAPLIIPALEGVSTRVLSGLLGVVGRMASRGIVSSLSRTGPAIAALMVAVSATIGIGIMVHSFRTTVDVWLQQTLQADIYVSPPSPVFRRNDATISPDIDALLRSQEGVISVSTVRTARVTASGTLSDLIVIDAGPGTEEAYRFKSQDANVGWDDFSGSNTVFISEPYAFRNGIDVGQTIPLLTDSGSKNFNVGAVYYDYGSDVGVILMSRTTYDRHYDDPFFSGVALRVADNFDVDAIVESLREDVAGRQNVLIRSNRSLRESSLAIFDRTFTITIVLQLLAVFVAFVGVFSSLMALQLERTREISVMRANGLTPGQVRGYVATQTGLMGLIAGLFSIPLGLSLAYVLIHVVNRRSFGWTLQMDIPAWILAQAVLLAVIAALLAGLYPGWKMSASTPSKGIRDE